MAGDISLVAQPRDEAIKPGALRRQGLVPGIVYGPGFEPIKVQFVYGEVDRVVRAAGGHHLVHVTLGEGGEPFIALFREVQRDPVTSRIIHVDLYRAKEGRPITSMVPIRVVGKTPLEDMGGVVNLLLDAVEISCLPKDLPDVIEVDLGKVTSFGKPVLVQDLQVPQGVQILTNLEAVVLNVLPPRGIGAEISEVSLEEEVEAAEGEQAAEEAEEAEGAA